MVSSSEMSEKMTSIQRPAWEHHQHSMTAQDPAAKPARVQMHAAKYANTLCCVSDPLNSFSRSSVHDCLLAAATKIPATNTALCT